MATLATSIGPSGSLSAGATYPRNLALALHARHMAPKLVQLFELYRTVQEPSRIAQQPSQFSLLHSFPTFCEECRAAQSKLQAVTNWPDSR